MNFGKHDESNSKKFDFGLDNFFPGSFQFLVHGPLDEPDKLVGGAGEYKVIFTLSKPGFPLLPESEFKFSYFIQGDSHLAISTPAISEKLNHYNIKVDNSITKLSETFEFTLEPNQNGFLSKVIIKAIKGNNFEDVVLRAYHAVSRMLSYFSFSLDMPLNIYQIDLIETRTDIKRMSLIAPFYGISYKAIPDKANFSNEFINYASYYREALISNNFAYQFLCLFKIAEGITSLRKKVNFQRRERGEEPWKPAEPEIIPSSKKEQSEWLVSLFSYVPPWINSQQAFDAIFLPEAVGKKVSYLISNQLNTLRVQIAHGLTKEGELTMSFDDAVNLNEVIKWLSLTRIIVRLLLKNTFTDCY